MLQDLINIVEKIKEKFTDESDILWINYETAIAVRVELEKYITELREDKKDCLHNLKIHFLPTSTFQEHALMNYWTEEYIQLAEAFDRICSGIKD